MVRTLALVTSLLALPTAAFAQAPDAGHGSARWPYIFPLWGSKLTGTVGRTTFGLLNAADETPEDPADRGEAVAGRDRYFTIGRATYALGGSDYAGAIFTDTEHAGRHNRVVGGDLAMKFGAPQQFSVTFLASQTGIGSDGGTHGTATQLSYSYNTRRFTSESQIEHYDRDFQMDTAFYNRTGFTAAWSFGEVSFYPKQGFWIQRVHPFIFVKRGHDEVQDGDEDFLNTGIRFNFTRQGFINISHGQGHEPWVGQRFETGRMIDLNGNVQLLRWFQISAFYNNGHEIYYDPVNPFQGKKRQIGFSTTLQPSQNFSQDIDVDTVRFDHADTGVRVFSVNVVNLKTTYQFDKHFLIRLLEQYDSSTNRVLTDLLASYEFVPGTVFHAGYGSLHEKQPGASGTVTDGHYLAVNRGLFLKASYLHRF